MSGHSKWSQIKRQKGVADVKRSANFTKLTHAIIIAAKSGGDPDHNFSLKMAIEKAKEGNMPKSNIDRAIKRGTGEIAGGKIDEALYEAIGPYGIGIIIEATTDNKNRTTSEIKNVLGKYSAKLASSGAVVYHFDHKGKIIIDLKDKDREEIELLAIDIGADDIDDHGEDLAIYTKANELEMVKKNLENQGLSIKEALLSYEPKDMIEVIEPQDIEKILKLMTAIEELDDVTNVYANFDLKGIN